jgi:hypothetical protein
MTNITPNAPSEDGIGDELAKHEVSQMLDAAMPGAGMLLDLMDLMDEQKSAGGTESAKPADPAADPAPRGRSDHAAAPTSGAGTSRTPWPETLNYARFPANS